jgi:hypothetical protein
MFSRNRVCRYHIAEQGVIPEGEKKGYRHDIDFRKEVPNRVRALKPCLVDLIQSKIESPFRIAILESYKAHGFYKTQGMLYIPLNNEIYPHLGNEMRMAQINRVMCGYYGWKGADTICEVITGIFIGKSSVLTPERTNPQTVFDYI